MSDKKIFEYKDDDGECDFELSMNIDPVSWRRRIHIEYGVLDHDMYLTQSELLRMLPRLVAFAYFGKVDPVADFKIEFLEKL